MVAKFTNRNHYNPCFWTAYWNVNYFDAATTGGSPSGRARDQRVFALNIFSDEVIPTTVDGVHFHKKLGVAEITPASMKDFYRRRLPHEYKDFCEDLKDHPESLWIDFEETLTYLEEHGGYSDLIESIGVCGVKSAEHKGYLSILLIIQAMRSYEMMVSMVELSAKMGMEKWEYFWLLKNAWQNPLVLARPVTPLARSRWTFYKISDHLFPICDSPVMVNERSIMAILSPRLLLEIDLTVPKPEDYWEIREGIPSSKYREFRRRCINNTFKEILFHDARLLEVWRVLPDYRRRRSIILNSEERKVDITDAAGRVMFCLSGFGRLSADDEREMNRYFI